MSDNWTSQITAWLQGIGPVAAVILALFLQVVLVWLKRLRLDLTLSVDPQEQDLIAKRLRDYDQYNCWLRARVSARRGKDPALNAEVVIQDWRSPSGQQDVPFATAIHLDGRTRITTWLESPPVLGDASTYSDGRHPPTSQGARFLGLPLRGQNNIHQVRGVSSINPELTS